MMIQSTNIFRHINTAKITVKNLLTMTAGIKDYINKDGDTNTYAYNESQIEYKVSAENSAKKNKKP